MSTDTAISEVAVSLLLHVQRRHLNHDFIPENNGTYSWEDLWVDHLPEDSLDPPKGMEMKIFLGVAGFLIGMLICICFCCYFYDKTILSNMRSNTDEEYQATLRARAEQRRRAKIVTPEQRRQRLLRSFSRHNVTMEVASHDIVGDGPTGSQRSFKMPEKDIEADLTLGENKGELRLKTGVLVPNCCAICLGEYDVGDKVVWSSNSDCNHAFHEDCILDWLIKMQPLTPCPCCRQEFTDLELVRKEKQINWSGNAFNMGAVRF